MKNTAMQDALRMQKNRTPFGSTRTLGSVPSVTKQSSRMSGKKSYTIKKVR